MTANPYKPESLCKHCDLPIQQRLACRRKCTPFKEEVQLFLSWNNGYTKGRIDLCNELETDPQSFLQLFEDIVFNEKNLTDEQLKQFHQLFNNQVIYLQKEAHRRGMEL